MRKLGLLILFISLAGCGGRGQSDLYRAYNISPMHDAAGKVAPDLATQNRTSLQSSGEYSYLYIAPEQPGDAKADKSSDHADASDDSDSTATPDTESADSDDASLPDDAAASTDSTKAVLDKIDGLKNAVDSLKKK